ncbi:protein of unknown function [Burkholderia multivorans]
MNALKDDRSPSTLPLPPIARAALAGCLKDAHAMIMKYTYFYFLIIIQALLRVRAIARRR